VADEGPPDGFETSPERRRKRLPALVALAALVVVGATLGVVATLGGGEGNHAGVPPGTGTTVRTETNDLLGSDVELLPSGRGPCVNDETQRCRNWFLQFSNDDGLFVPLEQRETLVRTELRSAGFEYDGQFQPEADASGGVGLRFRRGPESVSIYLQPDAVASECPASNSSCADILSVDLGGGEP
jgi:hypothetical protein